MKASKLFADVEAMIAGQEHGWTTEDRACQLAAMVLAQRPAIAVEIGVWSGRATIAIAMAMKFVGKGQVIAIDPWSREESVKGMEGEHKAWWGSVDHEMIYRYYKDKIVAHGVSGQVMTLRQKSDDVTPPQFIDLLVVDGNHSDQALRDIENFAVKVRIGGIAYLDDIAWPQGGVGKAVKRIERMGFRELFRQDSGAYFQRVKKGT